jgi:hypothetical protein
MSTKILCATDGSKHSDQAAAFAADMAKQTGAELIYLTVNQCCWPEGRELPSSTTTR